MKTAMMKVADIVREDPNFRLPDGFEFGEERFMALGRYFECHVSGPFPEWLPTYVNGNLPEVKPIITQTVRDGRVVHLSWQWTYSGENICAPIEMSVA